MAIPYNHRRTAGSGEGVILYHGTSHPFEIGDVITPPSKVGVKSLWKGQEESVPSDVEHKVFAADDLEMASSYAHHAAREVRGKPYVFQVEPADKNEHIETGQHGASVEHISKIGFKVLKRVAPYSE
jgi:hypothetical protein